MDDQYSDELNEKELKALRALRHEAEPSQNLEDRIISILKSKGLVRTSRKKLFLKTTATIAASLILFSGGLLLGLQKAERNQITLTETTFVLFLIRGPEYQEASSPGLQKQRITEYANWARELRKKGTPISGVKLHDEATFIGESLPGNETHRIAGYFLIEAKDFPTASEIAKKCPHAKYGGEIEIRRVHKV
jgi:hypothetical protein